MSTSAKLNQQTATVTQVEKDTLRESFDLFGEQKFPEALIKAETLTSGYKLRFFELFHVLNDVKEHLSRDEISMARSSFKDSIQKSIGVTFEDFFPLFGQNTKAREKTLLEIIKPKQPTKAKWISKLPPISSNAYKLQTIFMNIRRGFEDAPTRYESAVLFALIEDHLNSGDGLTIKGIASITNLNEQYIAAKGLRSLQTVLPKSSYSLTRSADKFLLYEIPSVTHGHNKHNTQPSFYINPAKDALTKIMIAISTNKVNTDAISYREYLQHNREKFLATESADLYWMVYSKTVFHVAQIYAVELKNEPAISLINESLEVLHSISSTELRDPDWQSYLLGVKTYLENNQDQLHKYVQMNSQYSPRLNTLLKGLQSRNAPNYRSDYLDSKDSALEESE